MMLQYSGNTSAKIINGAGVKTQITFLCFSIDLQKAAVSKESLSKPD